MARQDHTHGGKGISYATMPSQHPGGINNRSGPGGRTVYHSHPNGRTPHGHEPSDKHGAFGAAINADADGYQPGYEDGMRDVYSNAVRHIIATLDALERQLDDYVDKVMEARQ